MSLRITRAGLLDTIQDGGRKGYAHLGINPCGAMDPFSYRLANALLGKRLDAPVIELHFPAAQFFFEAAMVICITGADFTPTINNSVVPLHHPVFIPANTELRFKAKKTGSRCYLAFAADLQLQPWLGSYSTHLKAGAGGADGRALAKQDVLHFAKSLRFKWQQTKVLPWTSATTIPYQHQVQFLIGNEWHQLTDEAKLEFQTGYFQITAEADRMGYHLAGNTLKRKTTTELLSSGVSFGTVQLLPNGQLIVLMADHQTTGGYPRIAQVITAHLPLLAQKGPNDVLQFSITDLQTAEQKMAAQQRHLTDLQLSCAYQMEMYLSMHNIT